MLNARHRIAPEFSVYSRNVYTFASQLSQAGANKYPCTLQEWLNQEYILITEKPDVSGY